MTRTASVSTILPDAGKPQGRCEECGPHGNGGRVELLFSVVDCLTCAWRADFDALRKVDDFEAELRTLVQPGERIASFTQEITPLDPARVWGRRVKVTCTYSAAPAPPPVAVAPCAVCHGDTSGAQDVLSGRFLPSSSGFSPPQLVAFAHAPCMGGRWVASKPIHGDACARCGLAMTSGPVVLEGSLASWRHHECPTIGGVRGFSTVQCVPIKISLTGGVP